MMNYQLALISSYNKQNQSINHNTCTIVDRQLGGCAISNNVPTERNYINNFLDCKCKYFWLEMILLIMKLFNVHCCLLIVFHTSERLSHTTKWVICKILRSDKLLSYE